MTDWRKAMLPALMLLLACGAAGGDPEADQAEIQALLEAYLPKLAEAYETLDTGVLEGLAAPKEILSVEKRINDLLLEGRSLKPVFHQVTVEEVDIWNYANAFVTTVEVWDLHLYATGADEAYRSEIGQSDRVKYQLKREGDAWMVLFRTVQE